MPQRLLQFCILLSIFLSTGAFTATLDDHRRDYQLAKKALRAGKIQSFLELANTLKDYPLYPYLRYDYLQPRLDKTNNGEIHEFLAHYPDFPQADDLRARWLKQLARNRDWQAYFENYAPQKDPVLQCNYLIARINTGNRNMLVEDGRSIWLTGSSLPPDCNPVIDYLKKNDQMTNDLVWQRFGLAMQQNNTGLARYLRTYLDEKYRHWADLWLAMYANPGREIGNSQVEDTPITREIMGYGIFDQQVSNGSPADQISNITAYNLGASMKLSDKLNTSKILIIGALGTASVWILRIFASTAMELLLFSFLGGLFATMVGVPIYRDYAKFSKERKQYLADSVLRLFYVEPGFILFLIIPAFGIPFRAVFLIGAAIFLGLILTANINPRKLASA